MSCLKWFQCVLGAENADTTSRWKISQIVQWINCRKNVIITRVIKQVIGVGRRCGSKLIGLESRNFFFLHEYQSMAGELLWIMILLINQPKTILDPIQRIYDLYVFEPLFTMCDDLTTQQQNNNNNHANTRCLCTDM